MPLSFSPWPWPLPGTHAGMAGMAGMAGIRRQKQASFLGIILLLLLRASNRADSTDGRRSTPASRPSLESWDLGLGWQFWQTDCFVTTESVIRVRLCTLQHPALISSGSAPSYPVRGIDSSLPQRPPSAVEVLTP